MAAGPIRMIAPAKINLYLAVGATRPDGYHDVTTVLQALEFGDELTLRSSDRLTIVCDPDLGIPAEENLAFKAARAMGEAFDCSPDVAIELTKRVPHGAGLGGGSSDAAAVIAGLAGLWDLEPTDARLTRVARALGADVPFFLRGGAALFDGRGDSFVREIPVIPLPVALVMPAEPISTAQAYAAFDAHDRSAAPGPRHVADAMRFGDAQALGRALYNNMTAAAISIVPGLSDVLAHCAGAPGTLGSALCGSGSCAFALCTTDADADNLVSGARERGWWGMVTHTRSSGVAAV